MCLNVFLCIEHYEIAVYRSHEFKLSWNLKITGIQVHGSFGSAEFKQRIFRLAEFMTIFGSAEFRKRFFGLAEFRQCLDQQNLQAEFLDRQNFETDFGLTGFREFLDQQNLEKIFGLEEFIMTIFESAEFRYRIF